MFKRICKITFISHGATVHSMAGIIGNGLKSPKLNDIGEEELEKVCEYLKNRGVAYDNIYSCPNACCNQSAQIIAKLFKQKPKVIELMPRNYGEWQGLLHSDVIKENGLEILSKTPKDGESLLVFNKRVVKTIKKLITENKGNRIIIVATPEIIQSALANTLGLTPENQHKILIKTGSLTQISYFENWSSVIYSDYCPL
ncbi:MAG: phosphoglycerate mutase family protein [bacterium]|nr:phosphoglycerate mutase family protein [bacterium]